MALKSHDWPGRLSNIPVSAFRGTEWVKVEFHSHTGLVQNQPLPFPSSVTFNKLLKLSEPQSSSHKMEVIYAKSLGLANSHYKCYLSLKEIRHLGWGEGFQAIPIFTGKKLHAPETKSPPMPREHQRHSQTHNGKRILEHKSILEFSELFEDRPWEKWEHLFNPEMGLRTILYRWRWAGHSSEAGRGSTAQGALVCPLLCPFNLPRGEDQSSQNQSFLPFFRVRASTSPPHFPWTLKPHWEPLNPKE